MTASKSFQDWFEELRVSSAKLAAYLAVSEVTVSKWRTGKVEAPTSVLLVLEDLVQCKRKLEALCPKLMSK